MKAIKIVCVVVLVFTLQYSFAQKINAGRSFIIKGGVYVDKADSVFINYLSDTGKYQSASAKVFNGKFILKGTLKQPTGAIIHFKYKPGITSKKGYWEINKEIFLEAGVLSLKGDPVNLANLVLAGSKTEDEYLALEKVTSPIHQQQDELAALFDQYLKEKNKTKIAETHVKYAACEDKEKVAEYRFFLTHHNSYVTAYKILYSIPSLIDVMGLDSIKQVYNNYNSALKQSNYGKKLKKEIEKIESGLGTPGTIAANFKTDDINGKPLALADFKGKYIMVDFWASWCVPCRKGNPHMIELYNTYKSKGFDVISISDDGKNDTAWKTAVLQDNIGIWHHVLTGPAGSKNDINGSYGVRTLPTKILIDPQGKIIGRYGDNLGGTDDDMDKMLASIFNK